jgi:hypothetical protein
MVITVFGHLQKHPRVHLLDERMQRRRKARIVLNDYNFEKVPFHVLTGEVMQDMETLPDTPIQEDEANFRLLSFTTFDESQRYRIPK